MVKAGLQRIVSDSWFALGISESKRYKTKDFMHFFPELSGKAMESIIPIHSEFWIRITEKKVTVQIIGGIEECVINPTDPFDYEVSKIVPHGFNYPLEIGNNNIRLGRAPKCLDLKICVSEIKTQTNGVL